MTLAFAAVLLAGVGPGGWSLDHVLGWWDPPGWLGLGIAFVAGFGGAAGLLVVFWRPGTRATVETKESP